MATIATAVEEQPFPNHEISNSVAQASLGIGEVSERIADNSMFSTAIAASISQVDVVANDMRTSSDLVKSSVANLLQLAQLLIDMVAELKR